MTDSTQDLPSNNKMRWAGYLLSAFPVLMLLMSAVMKITKNAMVMEGMPPGGLRHPAVGRPLSERRANPCLNPFSQTPVETP